MLPPSWYDLVSKLIDVLVSLFDGRLSDVHCLSDLITVLLICRELSHHKESDSGDSLGLSTSSNLEVGDGLGDGTSCIVDVHRQI